MGAVITSTAICLDQDTHSIVELAARAGEDCIKRSGKEKKEISLSAKRIVEGIYREKTHSSFEVALPERVVFFKVRIEDIAEIGSQGGVKREKV